MGGGDVCWLVDADAPALAADCVQSRAELCAGSDRVVDVDEGIWWDGQPGGSSSLCANGWLRGLLQHRRKNQMQNQSLGCCTAHVRM